MRCYSNDYMRCITALTTGELTTLFASWGHPPFRTRQVHHCLYRQGVCSFDEMHTLPIDLRDRLKGHCTLSSLHCREIRQSRDGTRKFLFSLHDEALIETVAIREGDRLTLCLSTQSGCRQGCKFCVTGTLGFQRSLQHHEISDQVLEVMRSVKQERVTNIVLMGMGEPLDNYDQTIHAVKSLIDPDRFGFHPRRITLSTVGIIPGIDRLATENLGIRLAVSLNAPTDRIRDALMPINRTYPLGPLRACLRRYPVPPRQRITIEYCVIRGINDSHTCAVDLTSLLRAMRDRIAVNLIPYNANPFLPFQAPERECVEYLQAYLEEKGMMAFIRKSRGADILAACGQLGAQCREMPGE
ncbi:MAG: 23S rRNA (adenine(2503)-C(2))-methyltransferase RlmN [bacterium]